MHAAALGVCLGRGVWSHKCWCFPYDRGDVVMVYGSCRVPVSEFVVYAYGVWWVWKVQAIEVVVVIGVCYKCGVV